MEVILASASPRRKELLEQIGIPFRICVSDAEEISAKSQPEQIVMELSKKKADASVDRILAEASVWKPSCEEGFLVIGADTLVFSGKEQMGKPSDEAEAFAMLARLQGKVHQVYTGVTLLPLRNGKKEKAASFYEKTQVEFYPMEDSEIQSYIRSGEPFGKAGAYAIQGIGSKYIKRIEGDYNTVVGLPVARLYREMKKYQ